MKNTTKAHTEQPTEAFISASTLTERLPIPTGYLRELSTENSVPHVVAQGEVCFIPDDVTAWLDDRRVEVAEPGAGR